MMASPPFTRLLSVVPVLALGLAACAPATPVELPTAGTDAASAASGCTGAGTYRVVFSIPGSWPLLPESSKGDKFTPTVGLAGTKASASPATADLSMAADAPDPTPAYFNGLQFGAEASQNGYTIRITSICDGEVGFDLVQQPDGQS